MPRSAERLPARILVADDDENARVGLVENLELQGYEVAAARDGAQAIELIAKNRYDLIVSDVVMPSVTGVELLSAVRRQNLDTPFILVSAFVSEDLVTRALGDGLFTMLYKPFAVEKILEIVARALKPHVVLIVATSEPTVSTLADALRSVGMRVEIREDGPSAASFLRSNVVDVCVLDLMTQPLERLETCEQLQTLDERLDIIAISEFATKGQVRRIAHEGVVSCLRKPFEIRELLTAIARVRAATGGQK
ncbi:MAG TPA: response regulator [Polyangiaceae bacterium]|nr:response regulator [Polyangiaceae bacterium]